MLVWCCSRRMRSSPVCSDSISQKTLDLARHSLGPPCAHLTGRPCVGDLAVRSPRPLPVQVRPNRCLLTRIASAAPAATPCRGPRCQATFVGLRTFDRSRPVGSTGHAHSCVDRQTGWHSQQPGRRIRTRSTAHRDPRLATKNFGPRYARHGLLRPRRRKPWIRQSCSPPKSLPRRLPAG